MQQLLQLDGATVKAGTQEHGTERGTEVQCGFTQEIMQEVTINCSFPAATRVV